MSGTVWLQHTKLSPVRDYGMGHVAQHAHWALRFVRAAACRRYAAPLDRQLVAQVSVHCLTAVNRATDREGQQ